MPHGRNPARFLKEAVPNFHSKQPTAEFKITRIYAVCLLFYMAVAPSTALSESTASIMCL